MQTKSLRSARHSRKPAAPDDTSPRNATLTAPQEAALEALLAGANVTDAATAAGVDRTTVHRWLRDDFSFLAEMNRRRNAFREALQARLLRLADKAIQRVEAALEDPHDARTALALLKGLGVLAPAAVGSDNATVLAGERTAESLRAAFFTPSPVDK